MKDQNDYFREVIEAAERTIKVYTDILHDIDGTLKYSIGMTINCKYCELFMNKKERPADPNICDNCPMSHGTIRGCAKHKGLERLLKTKQAFIKDNSVYNRVKFREALIERRRYHWNLIREYKDKIEFSDIRIKDGAKLAQKPPVF